MRTRVVPPSSLPILRTIKITAIIISIPSGECSVVVVSQSISSISSIETVKQQSVVVSLLQDSEVVVVGVGIVTIPVLQLYSETIPPSSSQLIDVLQTKLNH